MKPTIFKKLIFSWELRRAMKRAQKLANNTRRKHLVLIYGGKPLCVSKQRLRQMVKQHYFRKGVTAAMVEERAVFTAMPDKKS